MLEEWLKIPGIEGYEVCNEKKPRVRNARTGKVFARNWKNQANMTVNGRCFNRSGDRCLYAALNDIDVKSIPYDVLIHYDGSELVIIKHVEKTPKTTAKKETIMNDIEEKDNKAAESAGQWKPSYANLSTWLYQSRWEEELPEIVVAKPKQTEEQQQKSVVNYDDNDDADFISKNK